MEQWKLIENSNGHYFISNLGHMKREEYYFLDSRGRKLFKKYKEYKPCKNCQTGYYQYGYAIGDGKVRKEYVHRLVAKHFIDNPCPDIYDQINHIDGDKSNNIWTNLEWCNEKKNMEHASAHDLINRDSEKRKKQAPINAKHGIHKLYIALAEYDDNGDLIAIHEKTELSIKAYRLSYKGHYYRQVSILKEKYGEVPRHIDVERIKIIKDKKRKVYTCVLNGEFTNYYMLKDLPITREELWFCFNHDIPDSQGRVWNIVDIDHSPYYQQYVNKCKQATDMLKTNTYDEVAEYFNVHKTTIQRWREIALTLSNT